MLICFLGFVYSCVLVWAIRIVKQVGEGRGRNFLLTFLSHLQRTLRKQFWGTSYFSFLSS